MMKTVKKTVVCTALSLALTAGVFAGTGNADAASKKVVNKAYNAKIKQLKKKAKLKKGISKAIIKCGKGEKVLAVAPKKNVFDDGSTCVVDLYQYVGKKVVFVTSLESGSTAYPITYTKKSVMCGSHHYSVKVEINKGGGKYYKLDNLYMDKGKVTVLKYKLKNGKKKLISKKKISKAAGAKKDYYVDSKGNCRGKFLRLK